MSFDASKPLLQSFHSGQNYSSISHDGIADQNDHVVNNGPNGVIVVDPNLNTNHANGDGANQNPLFCTDCSTALCPNCQDVLHTLLQREKANRDMYDVSSIGLALKRMPALLITMALELSGGIVINLFASTLEQFILLSSFMPIISALSGNLGLQTSSNITRGLATGNVSRTRLRAEVKKEILTGIFCSIAVAILLGTIGTVWVQFSTKDAEIKFREEIHLYPLVFGGVILLGTFLSMVISSTNGTLTPFFAHMCNLDPAKIAGPLETAFQDIAGAGFLLGISWAILIPLLPSPTPTPSG